MLIIVVLILNWTTGSLPITNHSSWIRGCCALSVCCWYICERGQEFSHAEKTHCANNPLALDIALPLGSLMSCSWESQELFMDTLEAKEEASRLETWIIFALLPQCWGIKHIWSAILFQLACFFPSLAWNQEIIRLKMWPGQGCSAEHCDGSRWFALRFLLSSSCSICGSWLGPAPALEGKRWPSSLGSCWVYMHKPLMAAITWLC